VTNPPTAPSVHTATPSGIDLCYSATVTGGIDRVDIVVGCLLVVLCGNLSIFAGIKAAAMANVGGANVLANLKQRMQTLRDELDRCKDNYDDKCRELEAERELRNEVRISGCSAFMYIAVLQSFKHAVETLSA